MNRLQVRSRWNEVKGELLKRFGQLTDDDLFFREGHEGELMNRLQRKLGKTKADIIKLIGDVN